MPSRKADPLTQLKALLGQMGPVFEKLDPDQGSPLKSAVTALQEQLRVQEPKAAKQARLQSVMAQGQAKKRLRQGLLPGIVR